MGETATRVQQRLRSILAERLDGRWQTEFDVGGTPVDVAGRSDDRLVLVELEWRRADPADNTAKLFRHLVAGTIDAEAVAVFQVFTDYYRLQRGGHSSKRENATFVGRVAAEAIDRLSYTSMDLRIDPPKRGGTLPDGWAESVSNVADRIAETARSKSR